VTAQNKTKRHSKTLVRKTSALTLAELVHMQSTGVQNSERPKFLPLSAITVAPNVFQWRLGNEDMQADRKHVADLAGVIKRADKPTPLDPILVMAIGRGYFVVDGHHRFDAYHTAGWIGDVPVEYFEGSVHDAKIRALEENKKNKLPLGDEGKREAAWKLLVRGNADKARRYTQARISEITTVPLRTVKRMASVLKKHGKGVSGMTWAKARRKDWDEEFKADDNWKEKKARKLAGQFMRGDSLTKDAEITAMALEMVSSHLPKMLVSEWHHAATDDLIERVREINPDAAERIEQALEDTFSL
jgi:hypothetical protein